jgi:hypothetical protein
MLRIDGGAEQFLPCLDVFGEGMAAAAVGGSEE